MKAGNNNNTGASIFKKSKTMHLCLSCIAWSAANWHSFGHRQQITALLTEKRWRCKIKIIIINYL